MFESYLTHILFNMVQNRNKNIRVWKPVCINISAINCVNKDLGLTQELEVIVNILYVHV